MSRIFINYRRDDSGGYAGRIYDRLADHFDRNYIFMDIDQIEPGEDFYEVINDKLKSVDVAVVLIGMYWLDITDTTGQRRLDNPDDWVRLEIATLLERNIRVIPILLSGAVMPKSTQLPECLMPLARRHAHEISHNRFHADVDKLIQVLEKLVMVQPPAQPEVQPRQPDPESFEVKSTAMQLGAARYNETRLPFEPEMVLIPSGKFKMGSPESEKGRDNDEGPLHEVTIAYAFEIGKYPVTFAEYDAFAKATKRELPFDMGWGRDRMPVTDVSWHDAQDYVQWLSEQTGKQYRLPTEAEWEYAARAGTQTRYWWGDKIGHNNAGCDGCGSQWDGIRTTTVGSFKPNPFGVYDTAGNVWEWTQDRWHDNYNNAPVDGSAWLETSAGNYGRRVVRGGSWADNPHGLRSANRGMDHSDRAKFHGVGFRIARDF